jgi:hypothetical protein
MYYRSKTIGWLIILQSVVLQSVVFPESCPPEPQSSTPSLAALLRHHSGTTQDMLRKDIQNGLDKLAVLYKSAAFCKKMVNSSRGLWQGTVSGHRDPEMGPLGNLRAHVPQFWESARKIPFAPQFILQFFFMVQFSASQSSFMPIVSTGPQRHRSTPSTPWISFSSPWDPLTYRSDFITC